MILEIGGLVLLVAVGAFLMAPMIRSGRRQGLHAQWPRVSAEVMEHRLRMSGGTAFPEFRARYHFAGREHDRFVGSADGTGHTDYAPGEAVQKAVAARMARRPVGSTIEIMVNPDGSGEAYLVERELPARAIAFATGAIFLLFFLVFFFIAFGG